MSYDSKTERLISIKKLAGKAHTSNDKGLANEALPSGLTVTSETVFGESITGSPSNSSLYTITGKVEYVRFTATYVAGSDTSSGRHGFELKLPSDYESNSSNSKAGTYPFVNGQSIQITSGSLQLVPTSFSTSYEAKPYYGGSSTKGSGTQIPVLDARDWYMDYFNGIFFQQDPPGTGDHGSNPDYVEAYLYIGNFLSTVVANIDTNTQLSQEQVEDFAGNLVASGGTKTGITVTYQDGTGDIDLVVSDLTVAGDSGTTGMTPGDTLTIAGGSNVTTAMSGDTLTVTSTDTNTTYTAGTGLDLSGTEFALDLKSGSGLVIDSTELSVDNSVIATLSGSVFSGHVGVTGSIHSTAEISGSILKALALSGSLTHLEDGSSYLIAGSNITIVSGSSGAVTISAAADPDVFKTISVAGQDNLVADASTDTLTLAAGSNVTITTNAASDTVTIASADTNTTYTSSDFTHDDLTGFVANEHIDWTQSGAGTIHATNYTDTNTTYSAGSGLDLSSTTFSVDADTVAMRSGTTFTGDVVVSGTLTAFEFKSILVSSSIVYQSGSTKFGDSIDDTHYFTGSAHFVHGLSGSLTHLKDGSSYLVAGTNVTIVTGSSGAITITSADTNTTYSSSDFDHDQLTNFVANEHIDWTQASAGTIHASNYTDTNTTYVSSDFDHDQLTNFVANEHIDWTQSGVGTIHATNYTDTNTTYTAGNGLDLSGTEFALDLKVNSGLVIDSTELSIDNSILATLSGSVFSGHVGVTGSIHSTAEVSGSVIKAPALSGSLTHLDDGSSYIVAGTNVQIVTGSSGCYHGFCY